MDASPDEVASVDRLRRAVAAFLGLVADVRGEEWERPTPCTEWDVRALVNHVVGGNIVFARLLAGQPLPSREEVRGYDYVGEDPAAAFAASGEALAEAFAQPGVLDRVVASPIGSVPGAVLVHVRVTELLVHGWDVARALGRGFGELPADLAEEELVFARSRVGDVRPERTPFAPPRPVADDAPAIDRLAALLGRDVAA